MQNICSRAEGAESGTVRPDVEPSAAKVGDASILREVLQYSVLFGYGRV